MKTFVLQKQVLTKHVLKVVLAFLIISPMYAETVKTTTTKNTSKVINAAPVKELTSEKEIAEFTRDVAAEKILSDFRNVGKCAKRIRILLSTFDAVDARMGKEKLSDVYGQEVEKLVEKVVEDKISYGLNNDQIKSMVNLNKKFNAFIQKAIAIVRKQEERR